MQLAIDSTAQWEDLIKTVDKDQIPIDCVKKVFFKLRGGKQKTINLSSLRKQGLDLDEIETVVTRTMLEMSDDIVNIDFIIDVDSVKEYVQPITNNLLGKL